MTSTADLSTREMTVSRPKLADELVFAPQTHGNEIFYHIEVPSQGKFYRVGYSEYVFLSLLDGNTTVAQALTITARNLDTQALSKSNGLEVVNWLLENKLAHLTEDNSAWSTPATAQSQAEGNLLKRLNPFWMKLSLGSPDRVLVALLPALGWIFSPLATLAGIAVIMLGLGCLISEWGKFAASAVTILTPHNWLWLVLAWISLKVFHELAHGLACKFYRGEVRDTGLIFILFAPLAYVDVTSCWRFPSKWQRIHVAAAGIYVELLLAAIAAIVWLRIESPIAEHLLYNVIVMASVSTLLFNANPLMRFDGYYILTDLLEIPNLAGEGGRFLKSLANRVVYGTKMSPLRTLGYRRWCVRGYGLASGVWRILICISLATAASVLLHGAGLLLSVAAIVGWFGVPLWRIVVDLHRRYYEARSSCVRAISTASALTAALAAVLIWVPWPGTMTAPVVVEYADLSVVRSRAAGFVTRVHVVDGQPVKAGELLVELRNDELTAERHELELALQQGQVKHRVALDQRDAAEAQIATRNLQAVAERLEEVRSRSDGLSVLAPVSGRIIARNLKQRVGSYVTEGQEILAVADETRKELVISVGQAEVDATLPYVGDQTRFRIRGRFSRVGTLTRLEPRASTMLPHAAMSSSVGGPLSVIENGTTQQADLRLVEPRFRGVMTLTPEACHDLGAGEQGYAMLGMRPESIGEFAWVRFYRWCEQLLKPVRG